jgi:hypothetical protein
MPLIGMAVPRNTLRGNIRHNIGSDWLPPTPRSRAKSLNSCVLLGNYSQMVSEESVHPHHFKSYPLRQFEHCEEFGLGSPLPGCDHETGVSSHVSCTRLGCNR